MTTGRGGEGGVVVTQGSSVGVKINNIVNLPPLGRHVFKGINCATESMGIGLSWFVFHFS